MWVAGLIVGILALCAAIGLPFYLILDEYISTDERGK